MERGAWCFPLLLFLTYPIGEDPDSSPEGFWKPEVVMAFTKTQGGMNPRSLAGDTGCVKANPKAKAADRRRIHKAVRCEAKALVKEDA